MKDRPRILIVDDDENSRESMDFMFARKGYETETAGTGQEALEKAQERSFNLALLDIRLPDIEGIELLAPLKEMHPDMAVILVTGYASLKTAVRAMNEGASAYITKPLNMDEVLAIVGEALGKQRLVMENRRLYQEVRRELTERKRAEGTLRQRNRELALLNRASRALISTLDLDRVLITAMEEVCHLLDVVAASVWLSDPETGEVICRQASGPGSEIVRGWRLAPGEGIAGWVAASGESLIVSDTLADERHFRGVDQQTGLAIRSILSVPLRAKEGVIGVLQVVDTEVGRFNARDLTLVESLATTEAVAIENARLYEETERLRAFHENIVQSMEEGILLEDTAGHVTFVNSRTAELLGYEIDDLVGRHWTDIVAPEHLAEVKKETVKRSQGIASRYETVLLTRQGQQVPVIVSSHPLFDEGRFTGVLSVFTDITERKRMEEALRESEELLHLVLDTNPNCIFVKDRDGKYVLANQAMAELYGTTPETMKGKTDQEFADMSRLRVEEAERFMVDDREVIDSGQPKYIAEEPFTLPDDTVRYFQTTKIPLARRGAPDFMLGVSVDITERKRAEAQLRQQERMAAIGQLAGGIAHDFNNLLTTIILYAQMLQRKPHLPSDMAPGLETIVSESRRAAHLVQQILDFSRRSMIETRPVDLSSFLYEVIGILQRTLPEDIRLLIEVGADEYVVNADPTRVQQMVMNLVLNARDAMPEGGELRIGLSRVKVGPDEEPPVVEIPAGEWVCLAVSDMGIGMPPDVTAHLFEPFFTTKPVGQGTGLGLAQVYGIVKQHNGHIGVETDVGRGTTFRVYLPAQAKETLEEEISKEALAPPAGKGETILLVEDEKTVRELGQEILASLGYRVLTAVDGWEALEAYGLAEEVNLVVTDIVMPEMGGKELVRKLRQADPNLKALAITGHALAESLQELRAEGILDVVRKPFEVNTLAEAVRRALDAE